MRLRVKGVKVGFSTSSLGLYPPIPLCEPENALQLSLRVQRPCAWTPGIYHDAMCKLNGHKWLYLTPFKNTHRGNGSQYTRGVVAVLMNVELTLWAQSAPFARFRVCREQNSARSCRYNSLMPSFVFFQDSPIQSTCSVCRD